MTATRYASIALSRRVVACGNIIFKPSETTPNNLIGRCREKSLLICIGFNIFQHLSVASPKTVVYVTMDWLPMKCMGLEQGFSTRGPWPPGGPRRHCRGSATSAYVDQFTIDFFYFHKISAPVDIR